MRIALAGNPNSGKTTLYNAITGKNEHAGNWAGVTVDKREAPIKKSYCANADLIAIDLPGAYSMSPFTAEESVTSAYIKEEHLDAIINIVDATNLSRSLFFTTQLLELGIPMVIALNKSDVNEKKDNQIDEVLLSEFLGCPVVKTSSISVKGLETLVANVVSVLGTQQHAPYMQTEEHLHTKEASVAADRKRFTFVNRVVAQVETRKVPTNQRTVQDQVDTILAHKLFGLPIFALVMFLVFDISQSTLGPALAAIFCGWIDAFGAMVAGLVANASPFLQALLVDGIIGGVSAVVGFLPLVMVMYFLIALLEDCGYMARATVVMDWLFKKVGLSGKSIIPMIIGTGCSIPGVMACRTIRNERERRTTAMLTPFMPCGAKLPVIALFAGAFFGNAAWVGTLMYFAGVLFILLGALLTLKITGNKSRRNFFIMELPEYKIPSLKLAFFSMMERAKEYIIKAGTVILVCNAIIQIMQSFTWGLQPVAEGMESASILASVAHPIALILLPLGFGTWQLAAAAITGFIAKENVVGTLAVVYTITNFIDPEAETMVSNAASVSSAMGLTSAAALAYLMFNLFTPPCFAAIGAMNAELKSAKWLWGGLGLQFSTGYTVAFFVYQIGTILTTGTVGTAFVPGLVAVLAIAFFILHLIKKAEKEAACSARSKKSTTKT